MNRAPEQLDLRPIRGFLVALVILCIVPIGSAQNAPRPISEPERAGVELLARALLQGPTVVWDRLAPDAPLRQLPREEGLRELEMRLMASSPSDWTLQTPTGDGSDSAVFHVRYPSELDDFLRFDFRQEGSEWLVTDVRLASEPAPARPDAPPAPAETAAGTSPVVIIAWGASILAALAAVALFRSRRAVSFGLLAVALVAAVAATLMPSRQHEVAGAVAEADDADSPPVVRLYPLLYLRKAVTDPSTTVPKLTDTDPALRETDRLWRAQIELLHGRLEAARSGYESLDQMRENPAARLLRARIALAQNDSAVAAAEYEALAESGHGWDAALFEAALRTGLSDWDRGLTFLRRMRENGSRHADLYYLLSAVAATEGNTAVAREYFHTAWELMPRPRAEIIERGAFATLLDDPTIREQIRITEPHEPEIVPDDLGSRPIDTGKNKIEVCGSLFFLSNVYYELLVPGGASIAPRKAKLLSASDRARFHTEAVGGTLLALLRSDPTLLDSPLLRWKLERALEFHAGHKQWNLVDELTRPLEESKQKVSPRLLTHRVRALGAKEMLDEVQELGNSEVVQWVLDSDTGDVESLMELADAFYAARAMRPALILYRKLYERSGSEELQWKLRRAEVREELSIAADVVVTKNFRIRTTRNVGRPVAITVARLLEEEVQRLRRVMRLSLYGSQVIVNVIDWRTFSGNLTGSRDIAGFFDGEITVPVGEVDNFNPELVSILTHELVHAILHSHRKTLPRWFHEGMAQRYELVDEQPNIFESVDPDDLPAIELYDAMFLGAPDGESMVSAYITSLTLIHYLEQQYGEEILRDMAMSSRFWDPLKDRIDYRAKYIDQDFREWGRAHRRPFSTPVSWPYHHLTAPPVDPGLRESIRFSREGE